MGLDFHYTCSGIDANITDFKSVLGDNLHDFLSDASPLIEGKQKTEIINTWVSTIYGEVENIFEGVRKCNEDMRQQADRQISELESRIDDLEYDFRTSEEKVAELEKELEKSENMCADLEHSLSILENEN